MEKSAKLNPFWRGRKYWKKCVVMSKDKQVSKKGAEMHISSMSKVRP